MKSFMLIIVSIVFLLGCKLPTDAGGSEGSGGYNQPSTFDYYQALILVEYENGEPCTTAYAHCRYTRGYANSKGQIGLSFKKKIYYNQTNPKTRTVCCSVKRDTSQFINAYDNLIWNGEIEFTKNSTHYIPALKIVITKLYN